MKLSRQLLKMNSSGGIDLQTFPHKSLKVTVMIYAYSCVLLNRLRVINCQNHKQPDIKVTPRVTAHKRAEVLTRKALPPPHDAPHTNS